MVNTGTAVAKLAPYANDAHYLCKGNWELAILCGVLWLQAMQVPRLRFDLFIYTSDLLAQSFQILSA